MPRKSKPAAAAKPVRAWGIKWMAVDPWGLSLGSVWSRKPLLLRWLKRKYPASWKLYSFIRVGTYDPRTHRAVAIKKARGK